jgi:hypothetical protein
VLEVEGASMAKQVREKGKNRLARFNFMWTTNVLLMMDPLAASRWLSRAISVDFRPTRESGEKRSASVCSI